MQDPIIAVSLCIPWIFHLVGGQSNIYLCEQGRTQTISGHTQGVIKTRQTEDGPYGNNLQCSWKIEAGEDQLIQLKVDAADLEWSPVYTTCSGYDNLKIYNGMSSDDNILTSICGARNPYSVVSSGSYLLLTFTSTHQNFGKPRGVELTFKTFSNNTCPPDWFQTPGSPESCFLIGSWGTAHWHRTYDVCTYSSGVLATINSESEYNTILEHGRNQSVSTAWIGLNNLDASATFKWIEKTSSVFDKEVVDKSYEAHCVSMDFSAGSWKAQICEDKLLNYVCKRMKDGSKIIVQEYFNTTPELKNAPEGTKGYLAVIIGVVVVVFGVLLAAFVYFNYVRKGKCKRNRRNSRDKTADTNTSGSEAPLSSIPSTRATTAATPAEPSCPDIMLHNSQMVAPPTYEESQFHPVAPSCY